MAYQAGDFIRLVGEGPGRQRVAEAVEWLFSRQAKGIGPRLLKKVQRLHGGLLDIEATTFKENGYFNQRNGRGIIINSEELEGMLVRAKSGALEPISTERALAHELVHAGQGYSVLRFRATIPPAVDKAQRAAELEFGAENLREQRLHLQRAKESPDLPTAMIHLEKYADSMFSFGRLNEKHLMVDPVFQKYLRKVELPAVKIENRVAAIRGEPLRQRYDSLQIEPEKWRTVAMRRMAHDHGIDQKPLIEPILPNEQVWAESLVPKLSRTR